MNYMKMFLFVIFVIVTGITTIQADNSIQHCGDFKAQQLLDIEMLFGKWYATELIYHDREEINLNSYHNECPVLFLDEVIKDKTITHHNYRDNENYNYQNQHQHQHHHTDNQEETLNWDELMEPLLKVWKEQKNNDKYQRRTTTIRPNEEDIDEFKKQTLRRLRLIWNGDGDGARSEYSLRYNESRPGYWMSFGSQSDTMYNNYTPFIGTIQVLKAVRAQTVLTFCHISKKHDFFTVVVSREPWLNRTDLNHIHQMLERKQLPIRHVRSMCMEYRNSSGKNQFNIILLFIAIVISYIFRINT